MSPVGRCWLFAWCAAGSPAGEAAATVLGQQQWPIWFDSSWAKSYWSRSKSHRASSRQSPRTVEPTSVQLHGTTLSRQLSGNQSFWKRNGTFRVSYYPLYYYRRSWSIFHYHHHPHHHHHHLLSIFFSLSFLPLRLVSVPFHSHVSIFQEFPQYPGSQAAQYGSMSAIPSPPAVLFNTGSGQLPAQAGGLYGAFQLDQSRSPFTQYPPYAPSLQNSFSQQNVYLQQPPPPPPHAPNAPTPDMYQSNLSQYRIVSSCLAQSPYPVSQFIIYSFNGKNQLSNIYHCRTHSVGRKRLLWRWNWFDTTVFTIRIY